MVKWFLVIVASIACSSSANAQCGGAVRSTPVRSLIASRPILSTLQRVKTNAMARRMSACQGMNAQAMAPQASCTQSVVPQAAAPCSCACVNCNCNRSVQAVEAPVVVVQMKSVPICENGRCDIVRSVAAIPVRAVSSLYQQALASAQYRAANRIHGHSYLDTHRTSGVGWSTGNASPNTCLGVGSVGVDYVVVRGLDGWYSTRLR